MGWSPGRSSSLCLIRHRPAAPTELCRCSPDRLLGEKARTPPGRHCTEPSGANSARVRVRVRVRLRVGVRVCGSVSQGVPHGSWRDDAARVVRSSLMSTEVSLATFLYATWIVLTSQPTPAVGRADVASKQCYRRRVLRQEAPPTLSWLTRLPLVHVGESACVCRAARRATRPAWGKCLCVCVTFNALRGLLAGAHSSFGLSIAAAFGCHASRARCPDDSDIEDSDFETRI
jgi:hypothetical protein